MAATDILEVTMLAQISGDRFVDTGRKNDDGSTVYDTFSWPKPGESIKVPRAIGMDLIHNEVAYPTKLGHRPKDRMEAFLAAGVSV